MSVEIKTTKEGKKYIAVKTETFTAQAFPINAPAGNGGSELAYNLNVILLKGNIGISCDVRRITKEGENKGNLIAGDKSRKLDGHRTLVSEFIKEIDAEGKSVRDENGKVKGTLVEKTSVPVGMYNSIMEAVTAGDKMLHA